MMLDQPVQSIRGIGPKRADQLEKLGICSVFDLLYHLPRTYLDYSRPAPVASLADGSMQCVHVRIQSEPRFFSARGMSVISAQAADETGRVLLKWFNQPYRRQQIKAGETLYAAGRVSRTRGVSLLNPSLSEAPPGIVPVYSTSKGLPQRTLRDAAFAALKNCWNDIGETLTPQLLADHSLCSLQLALRHAHFPSGMDALKMARRRLDFENLLCYLLAVEQHRQERLRHTGIAFELSGVRERFLKKLPFSLTNAQLRVLDQIDADMGRPVVMNRLLQGDVGSGKTVVALYAVTVAAANGYQGAILAPTEILAEQHYEQARALFGDAAVLLTGGMKKAVREQSLARIQNGTACCVVGTHALLGREVRFHQLGLVVTDEQHRFGVQQRAAIVEKGARPDALVMSATPIPRTLALLLYGDLDISVIDELPPGRQPVKTRIISQSKRSDMYAYIAREAAAGRQTYVVCPLIEDSEAMDGTSVEALCAQLREKLPDMRVSMLHGRMKEPQKQAVIRSFRNGETDVLVTTTVIEVGVHVPNACIMVVEGAERFGLSQLHQLRGRVGRGSQQAYCFLLTESDSESAETRMKALVETNDGFEIAQKDLSLRGPGDFIGVRQHGDGDATLFSSLPDTQMIEEVRTAVAQVIRLPNAENNALLLHACERYARVSEHIAMN